MGMVGGIMTREMHDNQGFEGKFFLQIFWTRILFVCVFKPDDEGIAESGMWLELFKFWRTKICLSISTTLYTRIYQPSFVNLYANLFFIFSGNPRSLTFTFDFNFSMSYCDLHYCTLIRPHQQYLMILLYPSWKDFGDFHSTSITATIALRDL